MNTATAIFPRFFPVRFSIPSLPERLDPRPGCRFCYRLLLLLLGPFGGLVRRLWLALLLAQGLLGALPAGLARAQGQRTRETSEEGAQQATRSGNGVEAGEAAGPEAFGVSKGWGPLAFTTQSPLQNKRMVFLHESPALHPAGSWFLRTTVTLANTWINIPGHLVIDEDVWNVHHTMEYTFNDRFALSLRLPLQVLGGGFLDGGIEAFHSALGLGNMGREQVPRDRFYTEVVPLQPRSEAPLFSGRQEQGQLGHEKLPGHSLLDAEKGDVLVRAPVLSARIRLNGPHAGIPLTLKGSLDFPRFEDETPLVSRRGTDWALGLSAAKRFTGKLAGTASIAHVRSRPGTLFRPNDLKRRQSSLMASMDYQLSSHWALVGQILRESPVAKGTHTGFDRPSAEVLFGAKHRFGGGSMLELAAVENVDVQDNTADFALMASFSTTFR